MNAREAMKKLPEEEKVKIQQQVEEFRTEQLKFDREVSKWDDNGNYTFSSLNNLQPNFTVKDENNIRKPLPLK